MKGKLVIYLLVSLFALGLLLVAVSCGAKPAPTPTGGIPQIPHSLEGRDDCLVCHKDGLAGAPKVPADHAGRTSQMCRGCHQPKT